MSNVVFRAGASEADASPEIRRIGLNDLMDALRRGLDDFIWRSRRMAVFLCLIYPIVGVILATGRPAATRCRCCFR